MRILFTGGGTLGSVIPLIVVYDELIRRGAVTSSDTLWIGTALGPERETVMHTGIRFYSIITGKLRRYMHWRNFIDPFLIGIGFFQAVFVMLRFRPTVIVNAGSYVGFPVIIAGWIMHVRTVIIQLDVDPVLTNKLTASCASAVCVAFPESIRFFPAGKTVVTGIPVRRTDVMLADTPTHAPSLPFIYIIGGSTGSQALNELVTKTIDVLSSCARIVHITGRHKGYENRALSKIYPNYEPHEFVGGEALRYMASSDIVISRAGAGALAELSALKKPAILIPLPDSPQEHNAEVAQQRDSAIVLTQKSCTPEIFISTVKNLLGDFEKRCALSRAIAKLFPLNAAGRVADVIVRTL